MVKTAVVEIDVTQGRGNGDQTDDDVKDATRVIEVVLRLMLCTVEKEKEEEEEEEVEDEDLFGYISSQEVGRKPNQQ